MGPPPGGAQGAVLSDRTGQGFPGSERPDGEDDEQTQAGTPSQFDLNIPLSPTERERLGAHLKWAIDQYHQNVQHRRGNMEQWRRDHELFPTGRSTRWQHSADIASPFTHIYCQSHSVRLNQQIVQAQPPFAVVARKQTAIDQAPAIEECLTSILEEADWQSVADDIHQELPVAGNVTLRVTYDVKYRRSPRFHFDFDPEQFQNLAGAGQEPAAAFLQSLDTEAESGAPSVGLHWENVLVHAGVSFKVIPWEDTVYLPASARDPEELQGIGERLMIRGAELKQGVKTGKYLKEAVDAILMGSSDQEPVDRTDRLTLQGINPYPGYGGAAGQEDPLARTYLCYELCWLMDANDDGEEEWVVVTLHERTHTILRLQYLPYEHGCPYYIPFRYFTRPRELLGMGIAEKIATIQDADTAVLNQIIDHADLILNARANFFYDQTSGLHPDKFVLKLGTPIPVDNVDGIKPFPISEVPAEHYQVHDLFKTLADLVTATSNPSMGKTTDSNRTLGEVQIVASASNMIFEEVAARVARTWAKVWDQVRWLYAQYGDSGQVEYRVSAAPGYQLVADGQSRPEQMGGSLAPAPDGSYGFATIPSSVLQADVDLVPAGLMQLADMQSRLQQASVVQNTLLTHPLTAQNMPALEIGLDEFLQAAHYRQREKILGEVRKQQNAQQQVQLAELMGGGMGAPGGAPPGQEAPPEPNKQGPTPAAGAPAGMAAEAAPPSTPTAQGKLPGNPLTGQ